MSSGDVMLKPRQLELSDDHDTGQLCIILSDLCFNDTKVTFLKPHGWSVWKASDNLQALPPNMCKITRNTASSYSYPSIWLFFPKANACIVISSFVVHGCSVKRELK